MYGNSFFLGLCCVLYGDWAGPHVNDPTAGAVKALKQRPLYGGHSPSWVCKWIIQYRLYLVCPIGYEIINKMLSHSILKLVQGVLVHVHTTLLSFLIYCMTHHQKSYVANSTNNYLATIEDPSSISSCRLIHTRGQQRLKKSNPRCKVSSIQHTLLRVQTPGLCRHQYE
jgi:hypothetical protein